MKKVIKFTLRIRKELDPPDLGNGFGEGVIAIQEMTYDTRNIDKYGPERFAAKLLDVTRKLTNDFITVTTEEL